MIRYVPRYSGVLRVGIRVIVELYIVGPRRLRVDELRLIMMRARRGMRGARMEVVLDLLRPKRLLLPIIKAVRVNEDSCN